MDKPIQPCVVVFRPKPNVYIYSLQKMCTLVTQRSSFPKENSGVQLLLQSKDTDILSLTEVQ